MGWRGRIRFDKWGGCVVTGLLIGPGRTPRRQIKNLVKVKVQVQVMGYPLLMAPAYVCYRPPEVRPRQERQALLGAITGARFELLDFDRTRVEASSPISNWSRAPFPTATARPH